MTLRLLLVIDLHDVRTRASLASSTRERKWEMLTLLMNCWSWVGDVSRCEALKHPCGWVSEDPAEMRSWILEMADDTPAMAIMNDGSSTYLTVGVLKPVLREIGSNRAAA